MTLMSETKIRIVTDSSCDLLKSEADSLRVTVVPLSVSLGSEVFFDGQLSHDEFWEKVDGPFWPRTSQPSVGAFEEVFARLVDEGSQVLCLTITSHHSGTFGAASTAAQRFGGEVTVVDSLSVSAGLAWQVVASVEAARQGRELQEIVSVTRDICRRTRLFALLDTIENIRRGGRVARVIPLLSRVMQVFSLKPLLNMVDGELKLLGTARSYDKGLRRIEEQVTALLPIERIGVIHVRAPEKAASFAARLADVTRLPGEHIQVRETGPALSCHAGPGVIGVFVLSEAGSLGRRC